MSGNRRPGSNARAPRCGVALGTAALALASLVGVPGPAFAGHFTLAAEGGYLDLAGSKSAKAVFGSSGGATFGGSAAYRLSNGLYVSAGAGYFSKKGERAFVADASSPAFSLGHPLTLRLIPMTATLGYRFRRQSMLVPYAGLGFGIASYHEESNTAGEIDTLDQTKASGHLLAGLELGRGSWRFAGEVAYSSVPDALGLGGVSQIYGERDAGGLSVVGKVLFAFGSR